MVSQITNSRKLKIRVVGKNDTISIKEDILTDLPIIYQVYDNLLVEVLLIDDYSQLVVVPKSDTLLIYKHSLSYLPL